MEQNSWEVYSHSDIEEISHILWKLKFHYHVQQESATSLYPDSDESSPHLPTLFL